MDKIDSTTILLKFLLMLNNMVVNIPNYSWLIVRVKRNIPYEVDAILNDAGRLNFLLYFVYS